MTILIFGLRNKESKTVAKHTIYHDNIDNHDNCHMYLYYCPTLLVRLLPNIAQLTINGSSFAHQLLIWGKEGAWDISHMLPIEAFVTRIKIESSDQSSF